jgi:hypothetical protein
MLGMAAEYQSTLLADTLYCLVGNMIAWVAFYAATYPLTLYDPKKGERIEKPTFAQRLDAADSVFSMPFFPLLMVLALHGTYELWAMGTLHARWHVQLPSTRWFQLLYVTRMATHMPVQWVTLQRDPKLRLQMSMHHVLSVVCFSAGLIFDRAHFYAAFDGCCETSTVFLNTLYFLKTVAPKDTYPKTAAASGLGLWLGFVFFRLILFPAWLYLFISDMRNHPEQTWDLMNGFERYGYILTNLVLLALSLMWFVPITNGLLKALGLKKTGSKAWGSFVNLEKKDKEA